MTEQGAQYDHIGSKYDEYTRTATLKRAESYAFFRMVGPLEGKNILDLACGFGFYTRLLKQRGATQVMGVDISPEMIRLAHHQEQAEPLGITYQVGDAATLPQLGAFDLVTAVHLLAYATSRAQLLGMFRSIYANLVAGGRFIAYTNNPEFTLSKPNCTKYSERLADAVRRAGVYVVLGCNEMDSRPEVQTIYNSLIFFAPDGTVLGRHRKLMPTFTERLFWGQGDARDLVVFDTDIGRLGGLICGEHVMTLVRACMIAQGEDIHVAVFPGAFELHTGPQLEEPEQSGGFWGHFEVRAHALEAGAFVVSGCAVLHDADVADAFPYKGKMNIGYAHGGSEVVAPLQAKENIC